MARSRFRGSSPRRQGPRRETAWFASADINVDQPLAAANVVLDQSLTQAILDPIVPATIVRTRGELWCKSDQITATEETFGAMGMAVVSEPARVAGVAALPTPITEEFSDMFFVHQFFLAGMTFITAAGFSEGGWTRYSFDSKSMRKVESGEAIVVTLENASSVFGLVYVLKFRMLFKLH